MSKGVDAYKTQFETERAEAIAKVRPADPAGYAVALGKGFEHIVVHDKVPDAGTADPKKLHMVIKSDDPMMGFWRKTAHDAGLSQDQFNAGVQAFVTAELGKLPNHENEMKALGENGRERITAVNAYTKANLTEASYKALERFAGTAAGITAIEELMAKNGQARMADAGGEGLPGDANAAFTDATITAAMGDPRYRDPNKRDPAFVAKVEAYYASKYAGVQMHGNKPARAG